VCVRQRVLCQPNASGGTQREPQRATERRMFGDMTFSKARRRPKEVGKLRCASRRVEPPSLAARAGCAPCTCVRKRVPPSIIASNCRITAPAVSLPCALCVHLVKACLCNFTSIWGSYRGARCGTIAMVTLAAADAAEICRARALSGGWRISNERRHRWYE
jgi:hypothetical protein